MDFSDKKNAEIFANQIHFISLIRIKILNFITIADCRPRTLPLDQLQNRS